ncbi:MAG: indole-3-glycerol phosphate synthase TrpC [bacterium]
MLDDILSCKRAEVARAKSERPQAVLERMIERLGRPRSLKERLTSAEGPPHRIVAEIKRASPSRGPLRPELDPADYAARYERAGAAAISVLTDEKFFRGSLAHLAAVRACVKIPVLRKDFLLDAYQAVESRAAGADAVLLIVRVLDDRALASLLAVSRSLGMEALVEVHSESDLDRALRTGGGLIGINNRDLSTFRVDLAVTERLMARVPDGIPVVSCSGIGSRDDVSRLKALGVKGFLVGECLVTAADPEAKLRELAG